MKAAETFASLMRLVSRDIEAATNNNPKAYQCHCFMPTHGFPRSSWSSSASISESGMATSAGGGAPGAATANARNEEALREVDLKLALAPAASAWNVAASCAAMFSCAAVAIASWFAPKNRKLPAVLVALAADARGDIA
jgi:hypothetical protein